MGPPSMRPAYLARVAGEGRTIETVELEGESDREVIFAAFGASSPFGHSLWQGRRFLGYFYAGDRRIPPVSPLRRQASRFGVASC